MTEESNQVNINVSFEPSRGTWMALSAAGALLIVGILASVNMGLGWGSFDQATSGNGQSFESEGAYKLFALESSFMGSSSDTKYSSSEFDDQDGAGLLRAAGPLAIVGLVLSFLAAAVLVVSLFVRTLRLTLIGSIVAALAAVFLILTVVLFPIGISEIHEPGTSQQAGFTFDVSGIAWGAGLIIGILAAALAIGATVTGFLSLRDPVVT